MADSVIGTTIRINAETGGAEMALARVERGFGVLRSQSLPALRNAFSNSTSAALMMSSSLGELGIGSRALSGPLGVIANTLGAIHPAFYAVAAAGGIVTAMLVRQKDDAVKLTESLKEYHGVLQELSGQYGKIGDIARQLAESDNARIRAQIKIVEGQIAEIEAGRAQAGILDDLYEGLKRLNPFLEVTAFGHKKVAQGSAEQNEEYKKLLATLKMLQDQLIVFNKGDIHDITVKGSAKKGAQLAEIERQLYLLDLVGQATMRVTNVERQRGTVALMAAKQTQQAMKVSISAYNMLANTLSQINIQQMKEHAGGAAFLVRMTGEAIKAILQAYAELWAAQAVALSVENPAAAAVKFRAAAMAGVAVAAVGALTSNIASAMEARGNEIGGTGVGNTDGAQQYGRTVISQGPITLNYTSSIIVNGNVIGIDDLYSLINDWNRDNLRAAGFDVQQRARG